MRNEARDGSAAYRKEVIVQCKGRECHEYHLICGELGGFREMETEVDWRHKYEW